MLRSENRTLRRQLAAQAAHNRFAACAANTGNVDVTALKDPTVREKAASKLRAKVYAAMATKAKLTPWIVDSGASQHTVSPNQVHDVSGRASVTTSRGCLLYTSPSPRDKRQSRMPSSA